MLRRPLAIPRHTLYVSYVPQNCDGTYETYRARRLALVSHGHTEVAAASAGSGGSSLAAVSRSSVSRGVWCSSSPQQVPAVRHLVGVALHQ